MDRMRMLPDWRVYCWVCLGCLLCAGPGGKETRHERRAAEIGNTVVKKEVVPMGILIFLIGMIVGCLVGGFLLALVAANRINNDEIPDDTDREGWE